MTSNVLTESFSTFFYLKVTCLVDINFLYVLVISTCIHLQKMSLVSLPYFCVIPSDFFNPLSLKETL